ncbi:MAG: hypothetical protein WD059_13170 [Balneolaceae bacterium]
MNISTKGSNNYVQKIMLILLIFVGFSSCKGNDVDMGDTFPQEMHGVWENEIANDFMIGWLIEDTTISLWSKFQGRDCYSLAVLAELDSYRGDSFILQMYEDGIPEEASVHLSIEGDLLIFELDDNSSAKYIRSTFSKSDLAPICEDSEAKLK